MKCQNCGHPNVILTCPDCGAAVHQPLGLPAPSKKRQRLPVKIMLALLCIGLVLFTLVPMDRTVNECFEVADGVLYFYPDRYTGGPVLTVPESVEGKTVTALSVGCFENNTTLNTIILPDTLTQIRERAFAGCTKLRGIDLPDGLQTIGAGAFRGCESLQAAYLPGSLTYIGTDAFSGCASLFYLFYSGFYQNLFQLYPHRITPYTWAICMDGEYPYLPN